MNAPPAPAPFISLGTVPLTAAPSARWAPGTPPVSPAAAIVDLGAFQIFVYSEDQAAAFEAAFAVARRMHAEGGQS